MERTNAYWLGGSNEMPQRHVSRKACERNVDLHGHGFLCTKELGPSQSVTPFVILSWTCTRLLNLGRGSSDTVPLWVVSCVYSASLSLVSAFMLVYFSSACSGLLNSFFFFFTSCSNLMINYHTKFTSHYFYWFLLIYSRSYSWQQYSWLIQQKAMKYTLMKKLYRKHEPDI